MADRWHTGFVDAAGTGGLLAQVEGRTAKVTVEWLQSQEPLWRSGMGPGSLMGPVIERFRAERRGRHMSHYSL